MSTVAYQQSFGEDDRKPLDVGSADRHRRVEISSAAERLAPRVEDEEALVQHIVADFHGTATASLHVTAILKPGSL